MQLALTMNPFVDTDLLCAQQLGVDWIVAEVPAWDGATLAAAKNRVEKAGLRLAGLGALPVPLVAQALSIGPEHEAAVAGICRMVTDAGEVGIPSLGYAWSDSSAPLVVGVKPGRGETARTVIRVEGDDTELQGSDSSVSPRLLRFLQRVMPVAEAAGVRLAYRTGLATGSLSRVDELDRLFSLVGSPYHGLDLDHGFVTHVLGPRAGMTFEDVIRHFGGAGRIFAVRLRSLYTMDEGAAEIFPDEDREATLRALQAYRATGFDGPLCPLAAPAMADDTAWGHKGIAFRIGYLRALLQALDHHP